MPYIKENRDRYDKILDRLVESSGHFIDSKGSLEYCVMKLFRLYMSTRESRYSTLHDAVYALQHVSDECRRRFLDKREDDARAENGDVS